MTSLVLLFFKTAKSTIMQTKFFQLTASEFNWKISDNKIIKSWGFINTLPGPVLKAKKGDEIIIKVKNNLQ
jgi:FtsP/CotA-like multicopper oxidase with cupredoxin domain